MSNIPKLIKKYKEKYKHAGVICKNFTEISCDDSRQLSSDDFEEWAENEAVMNLAEEIITDLKQILTPLGKAIHND